MSSGVFIQGLGVISPQPLYTGPFHDYRFTTLSGNRYSCAEPDYSRHIDVKLIRRMSRIIRMGITCSASALQEADITVPDAVIVGTAFGCLEDTHAFLSRMVTYKEEMLSPTSFIHSTHNTIAAQIALHHKSYGYNSTYVHRNASFECALADALLLMEEKSHNTVLVGGADETIDPVFNIMSRMGKFKPALDEQIAIYENENRGTVSGEGAAFFTLSDKKTEKSYAQILGTEIYNGQSHEKFISRLQTLLQAHNILQPDVIMPGFNGDAGGDKITGQVISEMGLKGTVIKYKHLCGEYGTSSAYAMWLASVMLKHNALLNDNQFELLRRSRTRHILLYNHYNQKHHAAILLKSC